MENIKVYENNNILYFPVAQGITGDMDNPTVRWTLYPIAAWDYVDPDYSDKQGWLQHVTQNGTYPNELFEEIQFIADETLGAVLQDAGYNLISVSTIYRKDFYEDSEGRARKISTEQAIYNSLDML